MYAAPHSWYLPIDRNIHVYITYKYIQEYVVFVLIIFMCILSLYSAPLRSYTRSNNYVESSYVLKTPIFNPPPPSWIRWISSSLHWTTSGPGQEPQYLTTTRPGPSTCRVRSKPWGGGLLKDIHQSVFMNRSVFWELGRGAVTFYLVGYFRIHIHRKSLSHTEYHRGRREKVRNIQEHIPTPTTPRLMSCSRLYPRMNWPKSWLIWRSSSSALIPRTRERGEVIIGDNHSSFRFNCTFF